MAGSLVARPTYEELVEFVRQVGGALIHVPSNLPVTADRWRELQEQARALEQRILRPGAARGAPVVVQRADRRTETVTSWPIAEARCLQLRQAGYHGQAVDMGERIVIHVAPGKHADLSRLPPAGGA